MAWFDPTGRPIKTRDANNLFRKTAYDGIGRTTATYIGYQVDQQGALDEADTDYSAAQSVSGDTVIEQTTTSYDLAGHPLTVTSYQRWADGTGTGSLLSSNARITYFALWYDAAGRMTHTADYGTNGGSAFEQIGRASWRVRV